MLTVDDFFAPKDGLIASVMPQFAPRPGQSDLSQLILNARDQKRCVVVEAPTGYGKSFAVLVPSIIKVLQQGGRVIISTETLALQDQYYYKDIPLLRDACAAHNIQFTYALAKGRGNYICRDRVNEAEESTELVQWAKRQKLDEIEGSILHSDSGDIASVPFEFDVREWLDTIGAESDCERSACSYYGHGKKGYTDCFVYRAIQRFLKAQIVVTNHTLLLLDAQIGAGVLLGEYDLLIVDEAHSIPERAQNAWGIELRQRTISRTMRLVAKMLNKVEVPSSFIDIKAYRAAETEIFTPFEKLEGQSLPMTQVKPAIVEASKNAASVVMSMLKNDYTTAQGHIHYAPEHAHTQTLETVKENIGKLIRALKDVYGDSVDEEYSENWLSFVEMSRTPTGKRRTVLNLKPIDVAPLLRKRIFEVVPSAIMMSATMKLTNSFGFMKRELGMPEDTIEFTGTSPFSFEEQVIGYFPTHLPDQTDKGYLDAIIDEVVKLIEHWDGRTMILFTNIGHMNTVCQAVRERVKYHCYIQGQLQKKALIEAFKEDIHSCLFATRSFFTGVDIPGETLSCVVMVKAPFRVPTDPMFKAKCNLLEKNGINPFSSYAMPLMLFDIRQSFGRLIRTTSDRGMFALLDSRALKKSYGVTIRKTLPAIGEIAQVGDTPKVPKKRMSVALLEAD